MSQGILKHTAFVALGSNLGDRQGNLNRAVELLQQHGVEVLKVSTFIETEPYGVTDQPRFLNGACMVKTELSPLELLRLLLSVEKEMGRVRLRHWGERNIDLDLLLYEGVIMDTEELRLPHPDMANRDFVMLPLAELAPSLIHPVLQKKMQELAEKFI